jgi:hypothetical protein
VCRRRRRQTRATKRFLCTKNIIYYSFSVTRRLKIKSDCLSNCTSQQQVTAKYTLFINNLKACFPRNARVLKTVGFLRYLRFLQIMAQGDGIIPSLLPLSLSPLLSLMRTILWPLPLATTRLLCLRVDESGVPLMTTL